MCSIRDEYAKRVEILEEEVSTLIKDIHKDQRVQQLVKQQEKEVGCNCIIVCAYMPYVIHIPFQIEEYKSKMESTVMDLKSQLNHSGSLVTQLQNENKMLKDKIAEKETKNIKVYQSHIVLSQWQVLKEPFFPVGGSCA